MKKLYLLRLNISALFILSFSGIKAQTNDFKPAFEMATKEVYDLLVDKRGFIWIATDLGISRYDGVNYLNFANPLQNSVGCTGLIEDDYGRIWFNNFSGQIFYIEHDTIHLLKNYDFKVENGFPRLALFNKELIATSDRGLFVVNTQNLSSKYYLGAATTSVAVLKDRAIIYGNNKWFIYDKHKHLKKVPFIGKTPIVGDVNTLHNGTYKDTAFMTSNPSGIMRKIVVERDTIRQHSEHPYNAIINTFSTDKSNLWLNTSSGSYSLKTGQKINGYNISDIVTDREGNTWLSSLYFGVLISYKKDITNRTIVASLDTNDVIVAIKRRGHTILLGTRNGFLISYDPALKKTEFKIKVAPTAGSINYIATLNNYEYLLGGSIASYKININDKKIVELPAIKAVKQINIADNIYIASSSGFFIIPVDTAAATINLIKKRFDNVLNYDGKNGYFVVQKRCKAVCYYPNAQALVVALKNGVYIIDKNGMSPFLFNNAPVYAASLCYMDNKLYIGTFSNGLLCVNKGQTQQISVQDGLFSKSVFKIKSINKHLWIMGSGPLQILNTKTLKISTDNEMPDRNSVQLFDIEELDDKVYLSTSYGLDNFYLAPKGSPKRITNYLMSVKVNNQNVAFKNDLKLNDNQNNIALNIGIPSYNKARDIYMKFCLKTETDSTWHVTEPGERTIYLASLMPGKYNIIVIAVDPRLGMAKTPLFLNFTILPPWWNTMFFKSMLFIVLLLIILYIYFTVLIKRLSLKKAFNEQQQLILAERKRISSEIHDDIGSGIFAVHLFADLASSKSIAVEEFGQIKSMILDLSDKIKEIIWSTNVENDNLENLVYYIHFQAGKLFEHADINFEFDFPDDISDIAISSQSRRNIYLFVKELVHNAIKHSKATNVSLKILFDETLLYIYINDNGIGFNPENTTPNAMGLENVRARIKTLNGELTIVNNKGTAISIEIPFSNIQVIGFNKDLNKWQTFLASLLKISLKDKRPENDSNKEMRKSMFAKDLKLMRFNQMVEEIEDYAIVLLDENGNIENWNKGAEILKGYTADEIIGKNFRLFYGAEDQRKQLPERLIAAAAKNGVAKNEGWRVKKDGSRFWGSIVITAIHNVQREVIGYAKVTRQVKEKWRQENR
jgi:PAS domain S-box-containing protein